MKIQIRRHVFETNSSSMHSLTLGGHTTNTEVKLDEDKIYHTTFGEFGWSVEDYSGLDEKLQYILTMIVEIYRPETEEAFYNLRDFKRVRDYFCSFTGAIDIVVDDAGIKKGEYGNYHNGYIDHQSYEDYDSIDDFLNDNGVDSIYQYLFEDVIVHTDNDNHDDYDFGYDYDDER